MRGLKRPKEESKYWGSNGVKGLKEEKPSNTKRIIFLSGIILCTLITSIIGLIITLNAGKGGSSLSSPEISRSKTYNRVEEGEEAVEGTDNVKFDAFFLRDLDEDGYAEGIRGTCKEIGKEDTLYMEINVQTAGVLKNGKITINGQNFYLQTSLPKDEQLKDNYIGNNTKEIELNDISNGTQKLITGFVRSGDYSNTSTKTSAIGNDTSKYSKENNQIVLTGTYVTDEGEEIEISKTVDFTVDWYGKTASSITATNQTYQIASAIDEENQTFTTNFNVTIQETNQQLLLSKLYVEGTIPELNGYAPTGVKLVGSTDDFNYDETTRQFTVQREATIDENGVVTTSIARSNTYKLQVTYPLEAYENMGEEEISIKIPVKGYYEGYNNANEEFNNPYKSNIASATIVINYKKPSESQTDFSITVGKYVSNPTGRYMISKQKPMNMYNGKSDKETNDTYLVTWRAYIGTNASTEGITMKENVPDSFIKTDSIEDSMETLTTYKGIYFGNITNMLGEDGYIKVYDDETDILLETFDKSNVNKYTSSSPYRYDMPVKRIRIETSATTNDTSIYIYHVKELDDEILVENYTQEEFENLQYIKSTLDGEVGEALVKTATNQANYEEPISIATVGISKNTLSTQKTEENVKITIQTKCDESSNQVKWLNGAFLVKLPEEILDVEINDVTIDNTNVALTSYELVEQDGCKFIKIITSNTVEASYSITIDVNITPDPRKASTTKAIELYASNENVSSYYYKGEDTYDVNNNLNTTEIINKITTNISLVSPSSLLTNQMASEYDEKGSVLVSPQIAEIKPQVATVDQEVPEKTAKIGIQLKNNYSNTISDVIILGKIPFEGNTYVLTGKELGSEFTTKMTDAGIELPEEVASVTKVYYSENTNPSKDLTDESNAWKTAEQVENWDNIKTFIIDLNEYIMPQGQELVFNYTIKIPNGLEYNKVSYSHHGVYFSLDTAEGKYKTQTEPNRIGFKIAEKYNLELIKYQTGKDKLIPGATYKITEEGQTEGKTAITNEEGLLEFKNLYVEKTYLIEEIKVPTDYELNTSVIKFVGHVNGSTLTIEKLEGETREDITVYKQENVDYKTILKVEDEAKARLKITKKEQDTENVIRGVKFKITGNGLPETGKIITTNVNGEVSLNGLKVNSEYILEEVSVNGYYLAGAIKFKIVNNEGSYELQILSGTVRENNVTEEDSIPTINMTLDNEKIPTYNLELIKIKKTLDVNMSETEEDATSDNGTEDSAEEITYLQGAKFRLYKEDKEIGEYITGEDGKVTISDLYQYVDGKDENATYVLKEILAPDGYAKVKDITFKVQAEDGTLKFINTDGEEEKYTVDENTVRLTIEDSPSFKLIKKDGETGELLSNIKFAIYNVDDGQVLATNSKGEILGTKEVIDGKEYYTLTTDQNGEITADLPEGLYKAVELQAPDKYDIEDSTYYFGIGASAEGKKSAKAEWAKGIEGSEDDRINSVAETSDGGYIVGGYFESSSIDLENGVTLSSNGYEDGMLIKYSREGAVEWAKGIGGRYDEEITSVAETSDGGYIVGGYFYSSSIDLGNGVTLSNDGGHNGYYDGMLIKYSREGEAEWAKGIGGSKSDYINCVSETSDEGYIVGGYFYSTSIDLGNGLTLSNSRTDYSDGMLIKYSREGEAEWVKEIGGNRSEEINSIAETSDGGYIVGGYFESSSIDLENGVTLTNISYPFAGYSDGMIIKYSREGEVEWAKGVGGSRRNDYIDSVAETLDGGYIIGGYFYSKSIDLGNGVTLSNNGSADYSDGMIIKYDRNGELEWAKGIGGSSTDKINSVAETSDGGYIVGGYFRSSIIDLENGVALGNNGNSDGMLIKYSQEGEVEWAKGIGGSSHDYIKSVAETSDGDYIVGGYFSSTSIDLRNGVTLSSNGDYDGMLIKVSKTMEEIPSAVIRQAKGIGGRYDEVITSVAETSDGGYIVGGDFSSSSINLGNGVKLSNNGNYDGMLIKYSREGEVEWAKGIGGSRGDYIKSVAETSDGGYIVGGYFLSSSIDLGNGVTLTNNSRSTNYSDGMLIKYSREGEVEWAKGIGGSDDDYINSVIETSDGGYAVGGYFESSSIDLGNGVTLSNNGSTSYSDGMIIKYDRNGELEWAKGIGGMDFDYIESVAETSDGGYIVGGYFESSSIDLGNGVTLSNNGSTSYSDGMIIKYDRNGELEWAKGIGGSSTDKINSVAETSDGGYAVGGYFKSSSIDLENGVTLSNNGSSDGMVIKYSREGEVEWAKGIGGSDDDYINSVIETSDGGYAVGGDFESSSMYLGNGVILSSNGNSDGILIKYSREGEVEWAKGIGGSDYDEINSVAETSDGGYIVGGYFQSSSIGLGNGVTLMNKSSINYGTTYYSDGMLMRITVQMGSPEVQELVVENKRKEYKITTDIQEIDGIKGGTISGEDKNSYETVKYGDINTKEIIMTPDENYEIISITVNGEDYEFIANEDGTYIFPPFENITEDKHIVVTYALKDNKIIINKIDSETQEHLLGAKFKLDQIEEREVPESTIGELTDNGQEYAEADNTNEITNVLRDLTNNGTYYFVEENGTYVPTNSKTYQVANGGTAGKENTTANSYIPIDLSDYTGQYVVVVDAKVSSENSDYGYATITENTTAPAYNSSTGQFIKIAGTSSSVTTANDYTSMVLEGGKIYYLHLGYRKDGSVDTGEDRIIINSVKVYGAITKTYNFIENNGVYESTNQGKDNRVANSYIPIDLTNCKGKYNIIVNANISSDSGDYGYATITETTTRPAYNSSTGRFIYISGTSESVTTPKDYTTVLDGGKLYYLHLGYYKNASGSAGDDKFTVNSISVTPNDSELYHTEVETNSQGQAITQIPFGKYAVTEIQAPEGYELNENSIVIEFRADGEHEFTIENKKEAKLIVHHYIKGTTTKLAEDEITIGKEGENYATAPNLDIAGYTLEQDEEGNYIMPENATGTYQSGDQEVIYYYVPQKVKLTVHHYIEGTETPVPLKDGTVADDIVTEGTKGENYTTQEIEPDKLEEGYGLVETPENATGTYQDGEIIVTYYYTQRKGEIIVHHYIKDTTTKLSKDENKVGVVGSTYETIPATDIPEYYELVSMPENYTGTVTEEPIEVIYYYQPKKYEYTVEYYFEGILDETLTETLTAEYGSEISTYTDKVKPKYHFDKSENLPLIITTNPEENIIKIYYRRNSYDITTEVEGVGGSISGQGEQPYESVLAKYDSTKDIIVTPDKGYIIKDITINGIKLQYEESENGTVTLSKFTTMLEDKHVVASFRKIFTIVKQGEEETTLLPGAKFTIKDESGANAVDRKGQIIGTPETIDGQELYVITTDEDGRIDLDLNPGKYTITEVQAPENYVLPELEQDRTYTIEVEAETKEERELKKNLSNMISFEQYSDWGALNFIGIEVSKEKGLILSGGIYEETTIPAEDTVLNEEITLTSIGIEDGIIAHTDENGKISWVKQIKSNDENSANLIIDAIESTSGEYIAMGVFMGTITIPAEETTTGESMTITSESDMDTYIIKYNSQGKVELLVASEKNMSDEPMVKIKYLQNGEFMMMKQFSHYEISGENTVSGEEITLDSTSTGMLIVKYSSDGKVKSAKEFAINEEFLNTIHCNSMTLTSDGGVIISADTDTNQQITVPAEDTVDGNEIVINQDENKGYQAIAVKCNSEGKIEYIKKIDSENSQSQFTSLMYINEIDNGYMALEYEGENTEDDSYQARILLLKLNSNLEIEQKLDIGIGTEDAGNYWDTVSNDEIRLEQMTDGSYNMLNINTGELSNYMEEVVVEAYPADAPTLTVSNELQKYEYKVEYYYDGVIDESLTETLEEKYGKTVETYKDKVKENYVLEKTENLPLTITNDPEKNVIKIYYATKAKAAVQYIDKDTGEIIYEETEDGYVGKEFDTEAKNFENYVLVEEPEEKTIEMQEETIVLKYYYVRVSSGVIEKHIDITSGEILFNTTYEGVVGTPYSTAPKEFEGYDLVQEKYPENAEGQMEIDAITVTYYYIKKVTITVEYVDIDTNEKIEEEITIKGHEGDEYSTEQKDIEGYEFVEVTEDKEGNMTEDKTITYYYKKVVPEPAEPTPEEPEQPTPPESTPGNKEGDQTIADTIIPAAGTTKLAIVLAVIAMIIGVMDVVTYKKYKNLLRNFK